MIGNTPLLAVEFTFRGRRRVIYAKSEQFSMTGSIKDRMALYILERAYAEGRIRPGATIAEGDLAAWCRGRLAKYKCPKVIDFAESLPVLPTGKVLRRAL